MPGAPAQAAPAATAPPVFKGVDVTLGGRSFVLPALSFRALEDRAGDLQMLSGGTADLGAAQAAMARVIHAALARNYPAFTLDELSELLDWPTAGALFLQVLDASVPKAQAGEPPAGSPSGASTGS